MADTRVYNRTRGQWARGILTCAAVAVFVCGFLFVGGTVIAIGFDRFIGDFYPIPRIPIGHAALAAGILGLTIAGIWGWITRPRLVTGSRSGASSDTPEPQYWPGFDPRSADSAASEDGPINE